ncbi:uncharacterized protein LOC108683357 [Hyalella azteca]|uniref:Uncharacterized protein LOC108683357 n=1 Tax=Hyalella azteca TaxID=294128 RepID=A0A8B7PPM3_HYAAZ|nr:uncharacterized protein LOC108683357 [Hyalella azteca]
MSIIQSNNESNEMAKNVSAYLLTNFASEFCWSSHTLKTIPEVFCHQSCKLPTQGSSKLFPLADYEGKSSASQFRETSELCVPGNNFGSQSAHAPSNTAMGIGSSALRSDVFYGGLRGEVETGWIINNALLDFAEEMHDDIFDVNGHLISNAVLADGSSFDDCGTTENTSTETPDGQARSSRNIITASNECVSPKENEGQTKLNVETTGEVVGAEPTAPQNTKIEQMNSNAFLPSFYGSIDKDSNKFKKMTELTTECLTSSLLVDNRSIGSDPIKLTLQKSFNPNECCQSTRKSKSAEILCHGNSIIAVKSDVNNIDTLETCESERVESCTSENNNRPGKALKPTNREITVENMPKSLSFEERRHSTPEPIPITEHSDGNGNTKEELELECKDDESKSKDFKLNVSYESHVNNPIYFMNKSIQTDLVRESEDDAFPSIVSSDSGVFVPICVGTEKDDLSFVLQRASAEGNSLSECESLQSELLSSLTESNELGTNSFSSPLSGKLFKEYQTAHATFSFDYRSQIHPAMSIGRCASEEGIFSPSDGDESNGCNESFDTSFTEHLVHKTFNSIYTKDETDFVTSDHEELKSKHFKDSETNIFTASNSRETKVKTAPKEQQKRTELMRISLEDLDIQARCTSDLPSADLKFADKMCELDELAGTQQLSEDLKNAIRRAILTEKEINEREARCVDNDQSEKKIEHSNQNFPRINGETNNSSKPTTLTDVKNGSLGRSPNKLDYVKQRKLVKPKEAADKVVKHDSSSRKSPVSFHNENRIAVVDKNHPIYNLRLRLETRNKRSAEETRTEESALLSEYLRIQHRISSLLSDVKKMSRETRNWKMEFTSLQTRTNSIYDERDDLLKLRDSLMKI